MTEFVYENIRLINGDCMTYMKDLPDNAFDLAIVFIIFTVLITKAIL